MGTFGQADWHGLVATARSLPLDRVDPDRSPLQGIAEASVPCRDGSGAEGRRACQAGAAAPTAGCSWPGWSSSRNAGSHAASG